MNSLKHKVLWKLLPIYYVLADKENVSVENNLKTISVILFIANTIKIYFALRVNPLSRF